MDQLGHHEEATRLLEMEQAHFGHVLKAVTSALMIPDVELARRLGTSRQTIHAKKRGQTPIRLEELPALAAALDVEVKIFYQEEICEASRAALRNKKYDKESAQFR